MIPGYTETVSCSKSVTFPDKIHMMCHYVC